MTFFVRRVVFHGLLALALASRAGAVDLDAPTFKNSREFRRVTLAVKVGTNTASASSLEKLLDDRAAVLANDGFRLSGANFGAASNFGVELQVRLPAPWFLRFGADWSQFKADRRDRQVLEYLGGRRAVSIAISDRIVADPLIVTAGLGRSLDWHQVRFGFALSGLAAPLLVEENYDLFLDTVSEIQSRGEGTALGLEASVALDYYTDARMNLVVEVYGRLASGDVSLEPSSWQSSTLPPSRDVDLTGLGVRLGFRWI